MKHSFIDIKYTLNKCDYMNMNKMTTKKNFENDLIIDSYAGLETHFGLGEGISNVEIYTFQHRSGFSEDINFHISAMVEIKQQLYRQYFWTGKLKTINNLK